MKNASLYLLLGILVHNVTVGMQREPEVLPFYQDAIRAEVKERWQKTRQMASRGWERTKQFVSTHKKELAAIAALIGITLSMRAYGHIIVAYEDNGINLKELRQIDPTAYRSFLKLGVMAYALRLRDKKVKEQFIKDHKTKKAVRKALEQIMGL